MVSVLGQVGCCSSGVLVSGACSALWYMTPVPLWVYFPPLESQDGNWPGRFLVSIQGGNTRCLPGPCLAHSRSSEMVATKSRIFRILSLAGSDLPISNSYWVHYYICASKALTACFVFICNQYVDHCTAEKHKVTAEAKGSKPSTVIRINISCF